MQLVIIILALDNGCFHRLNETNYTNKIPLRHKDAGLSLLQ